MTGEELFDVVNERDEVIGVAPRAQVHAEGLRHRAAHVLVFNPEGRLFVQRRSFAKDNSPGCWDTSAAGHLDAGEDYHAAALRELGEELGVAPDAPLEALFPVFDAGHVALVVDERRFLGLITRMDLLQLLRRTVQ